MKAVITVIGRDTVGVVAKVSAVCAELNINIEDVSQSIMQEMFCMIMLVDLSKSTAEAAAVRDRFAELGKEMKPGRRKGTSSGRGLSHSVSP